MRIRFNHQPQIFKIGCLMAENPAVKLGCALRPEFIKPGRPLTIKKILIVDDDPLILNAIKRTFRSYNSLLEVHTVDPKSFQSIESQTMAHIKNGEIDFIIMDGELTETFGSILTKKIRKEGYTGYIIAHSFNLDEQKNILQNGADLMSDKKNFFDLLNFFDFPPKA